MIDGFMEVESPRIGTRAQGALLAEDRAACRRPVIRPFRAQKSGIRLV
jgi:hypothetical protein